MYPERRSYNRSLASFNDLDVQTTGLLQEITTRLPSGSL